MANGGTSDSGTRGDVHPATRRLRVLAAQEAAATKQRLATRTAAARLFFGPWPGSPRPKRPGMAPKPSHTRCDPCAHPFQRPEDPVLVVPAEFVWPPHEIV